MYVEKTLQRKKPWKTAEIKIEDPCTYRGKIAQNMANIWVSKKTTGQFLLGGWITIS